MECYKKTYNDKVYDNIDRKTMNKIAFKIIGVPVPKGRPRFFRMGKGVGTYTPDKTRTWEDCVRLQAIQSRPQKPWEGPIVMTLTFLMPRPKSLPKKVVHHIKKPDTDNLAKATVDSLKGLFFKDDSQIVTLNLEKKYAQGECGVEVKMEEIE